MPTTPAFTLTITADTIEMLHDQIRDLLPPQKATDLISDLDFQEVLMRIAERVETEGYEMEVWKKGERETAPVPNPSSPAEKKKAEARAKLRGELVASLAEATHATSAVREEIEAEVEPDVAAPESPQEVSDLVEQEETLPAPTKAKRTRTTKAVNGSGETKATPADETPDARKARTILRLQELYSGGRKADVNKLLAQFGNGTKTFSSIPAEQFGPIAEAVDAL